MEDMKTLEPNWKPSRDQLLDSFDKPMTQMLFLETTYSDRAIYSLKDIDYVYKDKLYPSIKRLYLEMEDPVEYEFANTYFLSMSHWLRIYSNKLLTSHIDQWRHELELKLRSRATKQIQKQAAKGSYQAIKWLADKGWDVRPAGRPSTEDIARETKIQKDIQDEFSEDYGRLMAVR